MLCFHRFHFLKVTWEVESNHSSLLSHVYPSCPVTWVNVGGGCYNKIKIESSPNSIKGWFDKDSARKEEFCVGSLILKLDKAQKEKGKNTKF